MPRRRRKITAAGSAAQAILHNRGTVADDVLERFYAAGYGRQQLLKVIVAVGQRVISNYISHLADTPVDDQFKSYI